MKTVRIVPPPMEKGDLVCPAQGTEVYSGDTKISGIESMDITLRVDDLIRATMTLACWFEEIDGAEPAVRMIHPFTGEEVEVSKLVLSDGSEVDFAVDAESADIDSDGEQDTTTLSSCAREYRAGSVTEMKIDLSANVEKFEDDLKRCTDLAKKSSDEMGEVLYLALTHRDTEIIKRFDRIIALLETRGLTNL